MFINFPNYRCCTYSATLTTTTVQLSTAAAAEEQLLWDKMWNEIKKKWKIIITRRIRVTMSF